MNVKEATHNKIRDDINVTEHYDTLCFIREATHYTTWWSVISSGDKTTVNILNDAISSQTRDILYE
jgi:hypothetical protein